MKRLSVVLTMFVILTACTNQGTIFSNEEDEIFENSLEALEGQWESTENDDSKAIFTTNSEEDDLKNVVINDKKIEVTSFKILEDLDFLIEFVNKKGKESFFHGRFYSFDREKVVLTGPEEERIVLSKLSED